MLQEVIEYCNEQCNGNALLCNGCNFFLPGIFEGSCYFKFLLPAHWDEQEIRRRIGNMPEQHYVYYYWTREDARGVAGFYPKGEYRPVRVLVTVEEVENSDTSVW